MVPEEEAEGLEEPVIVAELGLNGQIMRRILQAGDTEGPLLDSSQDLIMPVPGLLSLRRLQPLCTSPHARS